MLNNFRRGSHVAEKLFPLAISLLVTLHYVALSLKRICVPSLPFLPIDHLHTLIGRKTISKIERCKIKNYYTFKFLASLEEIGFALKNKVLEKITSRS